MNLTNIYPSLIDKVVFISGGASGIGASLVEAFCRQGSRVVFVDIRDADAQAVLQKVSQIKNALQPSYIRCDITQTAELLKIFARIRDGIDPISVLINNAADDTRHDLGTTTEQYWTNRIDVNLKHAFFAIQGVYEQMKSLGGGSIINFGSAGWRQNQGDYPVYATAKAAIEGMTRGLARGLGAANIRINTIVPGWVMTERQQRLWLTEESKRETLRRQCLGSLLTPENVCALALFLASDDSKMCTSQNFMVDGGL